MQYGCTSTVQCLMTCKHPYTDQVLDFQGCSQYSTVVAPVFLVVDNGCSAEQSMSRESILDTRGSIEYLVS